MPDAAVPSPVRGTSAYLLAYAQPMERTGPKYAEIANAIADAIDQGQYQPGDWLPSVRLLARQYSASTRTVSLAIKVLLDRGLIETHQGSGTRVAKQPTRDLDIRAAIAELDRRITRLEQQC